MRNPALAAGFLLFRRDAAGDGIHRLPPNNKLMQALSVRYSLIDLCRRRFSVCASRDGSWRSCYVIDIPVILVCSAARVLIQTLFKSSA
jgi:hypothetical protein